jgi:hypothetical protein
MSYRELADRYRPTRVKLPSPVLRVEDAFVGVLGKRGDRQPRAPARGEVTLVDAEPGRRPVHAVAKDDVRERRSEELL